MRVRAVPAGAQNSARPCHIGAASVKFTSLRTYLSRRGGASCGSTPTRASRAEENRWSRAGRTRWPRRSTSSPTTWWARTRCASRTTGSGSPRRLLPGRAGALRRRRRDRPGAVGHRGQGAGRAGPPAARRARPRLQLDRRRRTVGPGRVGAGAQGSGVHRDWDFKRVLDKGIAVVQPDLSHAGGISEGRRIAAMAEAYDVSVAPHCPLGPIALAAGLQLGFATPNLLIEAEPGHPLQPRLGPAGPPRRPVGIPLPGRPRRAPGLGIEVDEKAVERAAEAGHRWRNPVWRHDGSPTEW